MLRLMKRALQQKRLQGCRRYLSPSATLATDGATSGATSLHPGHPPRATWPRLWRQLLALPVTVARSLRARGSLLSCLLLRASAATA